jgi:hypothetical protein
MSMKELRERYGVPAKRGGRISYDNGHTVHYGVITGSWGSCLRIQFDGYFLSRLFTLPHHLPHLKFQDAGKTIYSTPDPQPLELF